MSPPTDPQICIVMTLTPTDILIFGQDSKKVEQMICQRNALRNEGWEEYGSLQLSAKLLCTHTKKGGGSPKNTSPVTFDHKYHNITSSQCQRDLKITMKEYMWYHTGYGYSYLATPRLRPNQLHHSAPTAKVLVLYSRQRKQTKALFCAFGKSKMQRLHTF